MRKNIRLDYEKKQLMAICPHIDIYAYEPEENDSSEYVELLDIICHECGHIYELSIWVN